MPMMDGGINFNDIMPTISGNMPLDMGLPLGMNLQDPSLALVNRQLNLEADMPMMPMDGVMPFGMDPFAVNPIDSGMPVGFELQDPMAQQLMPNLGMQFNGGQPTNNGIIPNGADLSLDGKDVVTGDETGLNRALPGQDVALPAWVTVLLGAFSNFKQDLFSKIDELGLKCGIGCPLTNHKSESKDADKEIGSESEISDLKSSHHNKKEVSTYVHYIQLIINWDPRNKSKMA